jgi:hypothetical protein
MAELLATFRGPVSCTRAALAPALTLQGDTAEAPGEYSTLGFSAAAPADLPAALPDTVVEHLGAVQYRIRTAGREWLIEAPAVHLHREIAAAFYRAIPPRPVPWLRRLFLSAVLALAASRAGMAALRALRR